MYSKKYDNSAIRNNHIYFLDFIKPYLSPYYKLLDLGCGTGNKIIPIADAVYHIDGVDINQQMLECARSKIISKGISNIELYNENNFCLPFKSSTYDVCSACLTYWSASEVYRLLKIGGLFLLESLLPEDKIEVKRLFDEDELGVRGRFLNQTNEERLFYIKKEIECFFEPIIIKSVSFKTTISKDGLIALLTETPTIRDFSIEKDGGVIEQISKSGSVSFTEQRLFIVAKKVN